MLALITASLLLAQPVPGPGNVAPKNDEWFAWVNLMPIIPKGGPFMIVSGKVEAPPGYTAVLEMAKPQGINHKVLLLTLKFVKLPLDIERKGPKVDVVYRGVYSQRWENVHILYPNRKLVTVPIGTAH